MATAQESTDLVVQQVRNLVDVATDAYNQARSMLEDLADTSTTLPFSIVTPNIGDTATISWQPRDLITFPTLPAVPSSVGDPPAPITLTELEAISITIPDQPTLDAGTVTIPGDITVGTIDFPVEPEFPIFDETYLQIDVTPPTQNIVLPDVSAIQITIPDQPVLSDATVGLPGDIAVATVDFPASPVYPTFDPSYLEIATTPPVNDVALSDFGAITITIPDQPALAPATVELPGDIVVGTVDFPVAPTYPVFNEDYLNFDVTPPTENIVLPEPPALAITVPDQPELAPANVGLPSDVVVTPVEFPVAPVYPAFDESYLDIATTPPTENIVLSDMGAVAITIPDQPVLSPATVSLPGDITVATVTFPTAPVFPVFNESYLDFTIDEPALTGTFTDVDFTYLEPSYTQTILGEVNSVISRVLGGDLGLPNAYWTALWEQSANDLTRQQNGRLRNARNKGAASFWPFPSETVLAASAEIQDEVARAIQLNRIEQAKTAVEKAREDLWKAVELGISSEQLLVGMFEQMAGRALAAAQTLFNMKVEKNKQIIELYAADINKYSATVQGKATIAQAYASSYNSQVDGLASIFKAEIEGAQGEIELEKAKIDAWIAEWQGYKTESDVRIGELNAQVQLWTSAVENTVKVEGLKQTKDDREIELYKANIAAYSAETQGKSSIAEAYSSSYGKQVDALANKFKAETDAAIAEVELEKAKLEAWSTQWQGYKVDSDTRIGEMQAKTALWTSSVENLVKIEELKQKVGDQEISKYNADINAYSATIGGKAQVAQAYGSGYSAQTTALAQQFKSQIDGALGEIELEKAKIDAWIAKWNGYKTEGDVRINTLNAETQLWTSAVDNTVKVEVAKQQKDDREIELYKADISAYDAETRGKSTIAQAYTSSYAAQTSAIAQQFKSEVEASLGRIDLEKAKVEAWIAEWQGYKIDSDVRINTLNAQTQLWSSAVDNTVKVESLKQNVGSQEIELYKADVSAYSAQVDGEAKLAQAYSSSYGNQVSAITQKYKSQIDAALGEIELEKAKIEAWIAKWKGYETDANTRISKLQAETQLWTSAVSNTVNVEQVKSEFDKNKISYYTAQMGQIEAMARVVAALAQAHTANANAQVGYAGVGVDLDKAKNQIETQLTGLTQAAQEAVARLEIEQAQWIQGQGISIQQRMAELSFGYAQAAIAASDVSLSSGVGINFQDSSDRNYSWDMVEQGTYIPPGV